MDKEQKKMAKIRCSVSVQFISFDFDYWSGYNANYEIIIRIN